MVVMSKSYDKYQYQSELLLINQPVPLGSAPYRTIIFQAKKLVPMFPTLIPIEAWEKR